MLELAAEEGRNRPKVWLFSTCYFSITSTEEPKVFGRIRVLCMERTWLHLLPTLADAVIDGIKARGEKGNYSTQRVKFNSNHSG